MIWVDRKIQFSTSKLDQQLKNQYDSRMSPLMRRLDSPIPGSGSDENIKPSVSSTSC